MSAASIAAHLIVGARPEPFLESLLASLVGAVKTVIVNDNSPGESPHAASFAKSSFAREGRLVIDRQAFVDFSTARNRCLALHAEHACGSWVAFVDADEVHAGAIKRIAAGLDGLPRDYDVVDGYTWHFLASFDYYTSIERRMMFFRYSPELRWEGSVHEQLRGLHGKRLALPYVYAHYGHALSARRHAEKGRHYSGLGASGAVLAETELVGIDPRSYFKPEYPRLLRFRGAHPPAAQTQIEQLKIENREEYALTESIVNELRTPGRAATNALRGLNYEQRWRLRTLNPPARRLMRGAVR
ncbi:MAG: glycosyltransferase [Candidatus Eremiobacteraeota bacterium]|nr:glycosyltransferase [Candidatus Eremiobacteraeota bacterium]